jgi:hypothetical protein
MLFGAASESFEDAFNENAANENCEAGHCSENVQKKKADHSIQAQGNQQQAQEKTP